MRFALVLMSFLHNFFFLSFNAFYWVPMVVSLVTIEVYWILIGVTGFYWSLPSFYWFHRIFGILSCLTAFLGT